MPIVPPALPSPQARVAEQLAAHRERMRRHVAALDAQAAAHGADRELIATLPASERREAPLPATDREAFLTHLRASCAALRTTPEAFDEPEHPGSRWPTYDPPVSALLAHCCAVCRGACCETGGTHAHLRGARFARARHAADALDDAAFVARYEAHLPDRHLEGSCVFHTVRGCALPRAFRAELCNSFYCGELTQIARELRPDGDEPPAVFAGACDREALRRIARVTPDGHTPLPLLGGDS
jgi:hypothetical protein